MMIIIILVRVSPTTPKNIQKYTFYITWKQVNIKFIIKMHNTILVKNYEKLLFIPWLASHIRWKVNLRFNIKSYLIFYQNKVTNILKVKDNFLQYWVFTFLFKNVYKIKYIYEILEPYSTIKFW